MLLTDGTNNLGQIGNALGSSHSSFGYLADGRLGLTSWLIRCRHRCHELQNAGGVRRTPKPTAIEIYTIRLEEPNVATGTMLQRVRERR